jgi:Flp pilus assembly pilin Flp
MVHLNALIARGLAALAQARDREEGQTLVEYALILAIVSIGTIAALAAMTNKLNSTLYNDIINGI